MCCLRFSPENDGRLRYSDHIAGATANLSSDKPAAARWKASSPSGRRARTNNRARPDWLKVKCSKQQEFVIGGYSKPEGSRVGFGALLLGYYEGGRVEVRRARRHRFYNDSR